MRVTRALAPAAFALAALCLPQGGGLAAESGIQFDVKFSGHVDCQSPRSFRNLPLSFNGRLVMGTDGKATANLTMTAAYIISFKYQLAGRLGGAAVDYVDGVRISFGALGRGRNGLQVKLDFPTTDYFVSGEIDGERCAAELRPVLKPGQSQYTILAKDTLYYCDGFRISRSSCQVKAAKAPR